MNVPSKFLHILFCPPGANSNELGDIAIIEHEGWLHLFYLVLPNHDLIGHAASKDGLHWEYRSPALSTGKIGSFDDDMLWSMHVVKNPQEAFFRMYYTGCSTREDGQVQRIGLAVSPDLEHWERHPDGPVLEAAAPYNADIGEVGFVSFRDPFVFLDAEGGWQMLLTARQEGGARRFHRGCVGRATSRDGVCWELREPLFAPGEYEDLEVPELARDGGRWALFFNEFSTSRTQLRVADSLSGPWLRTPYSEPLSEGNTVVRLCDWKGRYVLFHWMMYECDWKRRGCFIGQKVRTLSAPKQLVWNASGEPEIHTFGEWEKIASPPRRVLPEAFLGGAKRAAWGAGEKQCLVGLAYGEELAVYEEAVDDFILEFTVHRLAAAKLSLWFRADEALEQGNAIEFNTTRNSVELHRYGWRDVSVNRYKRQQPTLRQAAPFTDEGVSRRYRLLACGEYIEVSVEGRILLSCATYKHVCGKLAFGLCDGEVELGEIVLRRLAPPFQ